VDLEVTIGGEVLQSANTGDMIFTVAELVTFLSSVMTLEPGDVIATGTPSGVGMARTPPRWLRPGEVVKVKLSGIGTLENPVTGPPQYV
jgi:2-keto-4-pentenoate hydratase/2-oxohepta-3-ene-1,7-dioic acid hydratase in catechol pathway